LLHEANAILYICGACACWGYKFALALVEDDCLMWPHDKKLKGYHEKRQRVRVWEYGIRS